MLSEIFLTPIGRGARLSCASALRPIAGQYLLAHAEGTHQVLPAALFVRAADGMDLVIAPPVPEDWLPGTEIYLRGPLGNGFHPPIAVRHMVLADLSGHQGQRLLKLVSDAADTSMETVLLSDSAPADLPLEIEFLPLKAFNEVLAWADYLAVEMGLQQMNLLRELSGVQTNRDFHSAFEVLVDTPLICGGIASCGVCSVRVNNHWQLACKDGPVFRLSHLSEDE